MTKWWCLSLMALSAGAGLTTVRAETRLNEARSVLEKWVETRQLISRTRSDWQSDKELLEQTVQLLERELKSVEEQMARLETNSTQVDKERLQAETQLTASNESLNRTKGFAADFEQQMRQQIPRFPAPLQEILKPWLARIPTDPTTTKMMATERIQLIVAMLNEFDKFNNAVTVFNEKRKNEKGAEVAVETVYVGLGAAYFVNEAGDFAGAGKPGPSGWVWQVQSDLASAVREVIRIYRNERPARFIALPVTIQ